MKRLFAVIMMLLPFAVVAQNSAVTKAESKFNDGKYAEALELITPALTHEKTMDKGRTWYISGTIYEAIALADTVPEMTALAPNALEEAVKSFNKVFELEKESSSYHFFASQEMDKMWGTMINKGAQQFDKDDVEKAYEYFEKSKLVRPQDTTSLLYTGVAAQMAEKYDVALQNYNELFKQGHYNEEIYGSMFYIQRSIKKDNEAALATLQDGISHFPDNEDFKSLEIEMLVTMDKIGEAMTKIEEKIAADPTDPVLFFSLGYMYDETGNRDKAKENYEKAVEIEPSYYEANVNLAVIYYNEAINLFKEFNNLSMTDYKKKGPAMEAEAKALMEKSLPYWIAAHESKPDQRVPIESLQNVYVRLKNYEKAEEYRKKLDALEGNN